MRKRFKISSRRSKRLFTKTAFPLRANRTKVTGKGIKRGGTRL